MVNTVPVREVKVGETNTRSLTLEDYEYRLTAEKFAKNYIDKNWAEEGEMSNWMFNLLYFILGAFFWETIPVFIQAGTWAWTFIKPFIIFVL